MWPLPFTSFPVMVTLSYTINVLLYIFVVFVCNVLRFAMIFQNHRNILRNATRITRFLVKSIRLRQSIAIFSAADRRRRLFFRNIIVVGRSFYFSEQRIGQFAQMCVSRAWAISASLQTLPLKEVLTSQAYKYIIFINFAWNIFVRQSLCSWCNDE